MTWFDSAACRSYRPACGTYAGWKSHRQRKEETCDQCRQAYARYKTPNPQRKYTPRGNAA